MSDVEIIEKRRGYGFWLWGVALYLATFAIYVLSRHLSDLADPNGEFDANSVFELGINFLVFVIGCCYLLWIFIKKRADFKKKYMYWLTIAVVWEIVLFICMSVLASNMGIGREWIGLYFSYSSGIFGLLFQGLVFWLPYILKSKRVREVFVN